MFFEENTLLENLQCLICNQLFQDPVVLPCGEPVCEKCIYDQLKEQPTLNSNLFKCCFCHESHSIPDPEIGFPESKRMKLMLELKPKKINRGVTIETFQTEINKCIEEINEIKCRFESKEQSLREHFQLKRDEILIAAEIRVEELHKISRDLLDQMNKLENENLEELKDDCQQKEIEAELKKAEEFCTEWAARIKLPETNEDDVKKEQPKFDHFRKLVQETNTLTKNSLFDFKKVNFVRNLDEVIESSLIGRIECASEASSLENVSEISRNLNLDDHLLLGLNKLNNGNMLASYAYNFHKKSTKSDKFEFDINFSSTDSFGKIIKTYANHSGFKSIKFDEKNHQRSFISWTNGTHFIASIFRGKYQCIFIITNENEESICESIFTTNKECNILIDSQKFYIIFEQRKKIEVIDFNLKTLNSIKINEDLICLFKSESITINEDLLYAFQSNIITVYQLDNLEPIKSIEINVYDSPVSQQFLKSYFVLRFDTFLHYVDLKTRKEFLKTVTDLDLSDQNLQMRCLADDRLLFFNNQTKQIHILS